MKAIWNGVVVAESDDIVTVEGEHYFPQAALKSEYTSFSNHRTSDWKGQAYYQSLFVNGEMKADAEWPERLGAAQHRLICRHCRAFSANDARLSAILSRYQDRLTQPDEPPRRPDGSSTPP